MKIELRDGVKVLVAVFNEDLHDGAFKVPDDVHVIGKGAFNACVKNLTRVDMPNVTTIRSFAFSDCRNLTHANMPSVTNIGDRAFLMCTSLIHANMPSATTIGEDAFAMCKSLTHADMPSATTIGLDAFFCCKNLTHANMPSATCIYIGAFYGCENLTHANMPSATYIGGSAFAKCTALTHADMPSATCIGYDIGYGAFYGCESLTRVTASPALVSIKAEAFKYCNVLTHIVINSDINDEVARVSALFPVALQQYVLSKSADVQGPAVERTIKEYRATSPLRDLYNKMGIQPVQSMMEQLVEPIGLPELRDALFSVPCPLNPDDFPAYEKRLKSIKERRIERYRVIDELEQYIRILEKILLDTNASPKSIELHQNLRTTSQKIIRFLQDGIPAALSLEEKKRVQKTRLVTIIPQEIQNQLEIHPDSTPLPVPAEQAREAQQNNVLLSRIDPIIDGLWDKIQGGDGVEIGAHYREAREVATQLHYDLKQARNSLKDQLESGYSTRSQAVSAFRLRCEELVEEALPKLERDKSLCQYLSDMLKSLANLFIGVAQKLGSRATFFNTSSASSQSITETRQELISIISPL